MRKGKMKNRIETAKKITGKLFIVLMFFSVALWARPQNAPIIKKIVIKSVTGKVIPQQIILQKMRSKTGDRFNPKTLSEDIKTLIKTDEFAEGGVHSTIETTNDNQIIITITIKMKPIVERIIYVGNKKISTKKLAKITDQEVGSRLDVETVSSDLEVFYNKYMSKGYNGTKIDYDFYLDKKTGKHTLCYKFTETSRQKIKRVNFFGNRTFSTRKLRKAILSKKTFWGHIFSVGYLNSGKLKMDKFTLQKMYKGKGYLDFEIVRIEKVISKNGKWITLNVYLDEGTPYVISDISIKGNKRFSSAELLKHSVLKKGDICLGTRIDKQINKIKSEYDILGYLDLKCYDQLTKDSTKHKVAVALNIYEGEPSTIRNIIITGNEKTKDYVIRRELLMFPGDKGRRSKIKSSENILRGLNYFSEVNIVPLATIKQGEKDLQVTVKEKQTGILQLGGGFSSADSVVGFFEIQENNFNWRDWHTFKGAGQRVKFRGQVGTRRNDASISFIEPWFLDRRLRLSLDLYHHQRYEEDYKQTSTGFTSMLAWRWRKYWRPTVGLKLQRIKIGDFDNNISKQLEDEGGSYNASAFVLGIQRDSRNAYFNASSGSKISFNTEIITEALGAYSNIAKINLAGSKYFPVFKKSIIRVSAEAGILEKLSGDDPAIFNRYFAGGQRSVRGFDRHEISPVDTEGKENYLGGESKFIASVEYIYPVNHIFRLSFFCDAGNVWEKKSEINLGELNVSVGVGLQLTLPIGPIRLDYGYPVHTEYEHLENNSGRIHFNMGYSF